MYLLVLSLQFVVTVCLEQLKSHGTDQMTLTSPEMSTYFVTPTSNHFYQGLHIRRFQFFVSTRKTECRKGRHFLKWLCEMHRNAMVLRSPPSDRFATRVKMKAQWHQLTPTSNHFCQGTPHQTLSIFCFYQKDRMSERKACPELVVGDT